MRQVSSHLITMMSEKGSKIAPHLHIPLQSGSTKVLQDMHRPYTQDDFVRLCDTVHERIPDVAITTDIMVGFPTETDEDFEQTVRVCERVRFAKGHIFRFSLRPGTPAHQWGDAVPAKIKQERSARLIEITNQTRDEFSRRFVGRRLSATVEGRRSSDGLLTAITGNYIHVEFPGPESLAGKVVPINIVSAQSGCAAGHIAADRLPLRMVE
jgi:MiaB/RimO family radical SAM methylthiotransferase